MSGNISVGYLLEEAANLLQARLFKSAENVALLAISNLTKTDLKPSSKTTNGNSTANTSNLLSDFYEIVGDAALGQQNQVKRALAYYRLAVHYKTPVGIKSTGMNKHASWIVSQNDVSLCLKLARCNRDLGDVALGIEDLESVPPKLRDLATLSTLGQLYLSVNRKTEAVRALSEAYAKAPYATEILQQLVALAVDEKDLHRLLSDYHASAAHSSQSQQQNSQPNNKLTTLTQTQFGSISSSTPDWMIMLISGLCQQHRFESVKSLENLQRLQPLFPRNIFLMRVTAESWTQHEIDDQAIALYRNLMRVDPHYTLHLDRAAWLLHCRGEDDILQRLVNALMDASRGTAPEALVAAAYYCLSKKDITSAHLDQALAFADRALYLSHDAHAEAWRCRARIRCKNASLSANPAGTSAIYAAALADYLQANTREKDLASFVGIVETNVILGKFRDAASAAKEMVLLYPRSARALYTLGSVMAKSSEGVGESIKAYTKALRLHPRLLDASVALCSTFLALGRLEEAEFCAKQALTHDTQPKILVLLGKALARQERYAEALTPLRTCLTLINPSSSASSSTSSQSRSLYSFLTSSTHPAAHTMGGTASHTSAGSSSLSTLHTVVLEEAQAEIDRIEGVLREANQQTVEDEDEDVGEEVSMQEEEEEEEEFDEGEVVDEEAEEEDISEDNFLRRSSRHHHMHEEDEEEEDTRFRRR